MIGSVPIALQSRNSSLAGFYFTPNTQIMMTHFLHRSQQGAPSEAILEDSRGSGKQLSIPAPLQGRLSQVSSSLSQPSRAGIIKRRVSPVENILGWLRRVQNDRSCTLHG